MTIRKMTLQVSFLYDDTSQRPHEWPLGTIAREIDEGDCIGATETISDDPLNDDQVRATEIEWGGDGTFMLGGL